MTDNHHFSILSVLTVVLLVGIGGLFLVTSKDPDTIVYREYPVITGGATSTTMSFDTNVQETTYITTDTTVKNCNINFGQTITAKACQDGTIISADPSASASCTATSENVFNSGIATFNVEVSKLANFATAWPGSTLSVQVISVSGGATSLIVGEQLVPTNPTTLAISTNPSGSSTEVMYCIDVSDVSALTAGVADFNIQYDAV